MKEWNKTKSIRQCSVCAWNLINQPIEVVIVKKQALTEKPASITICSIQASHLLLMNKPTMLVREVMKKFGRAQFPLSNGVVFQKMIWFCFILRSFFKYCRNWDLSAVLTLIIDFSLTKICFFVGLCKFQYNVVSLVFRYFSSERIIIFSVPRKLKMSRFVGDFASLLGMEIKYCFLLDDEV